MAKTVPSFAPSGFKGGNLPRPSLLTERLTSFSQVDAQQRLRSLLLGR